MFYFLKQAFDGALKVSECVQTTDYLIPYDGNEAESTVGQPVADGIKKRSAELRRDALITGTISGATDAVEALTTPFF